MLDIGVRELKSRAAEVVRQVRTRAARYIITYRGKPVAQLVPLSEASLPRLSLSSAEEPSLTQREMAARAMAGIKAIRQKLAGWTADATQAVVASHEEET